MTRLRAQRDQLLQQIAAPWLQQIDFVRLGQRHADGVARPLEFTEETAAQFAQAVFHCLERFQAFVDRSLQLAGIAHQIAAGQGGDAVDAVQLPACGGGLALQPALVAREQRLEAVRKTLLARCLVPGIELGAQRSEHLGMTRSGGHRMHAQHGQIAGGQGGLHALHHRGTVAVGELVGMADGDEARGLRIQPRQEGQILLAEVALLDRGHPDDGVGARQLRRSQIGVGALAPLGPAGVAGGVDEGQVGPREIAPRDEGGAECPRHLAAVAGHLVVREAGELVVGQRHAQAVQIERVNGVVLARQHVSRQCRGGIDFHHHQPLADQGVDQAGLARRERTTKGDDAAGRQTRVGAELAEAAQLAGKAQVDVGEVVGAAQARQRQQFLVDQRVEAADRLQCRLWILCAGRGLQGPAKQVVAWG